MTIAKVLEFIRERNGKIFSVIFIKRTNNEERQMACRQGVKSHLAENPSKEGIDFAANGLIPVFDMSKNAYRSIPIEGIVKILIDGKWHKVSH